MNIYKEVVRRINGFCHGNADEYLHQAWLEHYERHGKNLLDEHPAYVIRAVKYKFLNFLRSRKRQVNKELVPIWSSFTAPVINVLSTQPAHYEDDIPQITQEFLEKLKQGRQLAVVCKETGVRYRNLSELVRVEFPNRNHNSTRVMIIGAIKGGRTFEGRTFTYAPRVHYEIAVRLMDGYKGDEIAEELCISKSAVAHIRKQIKDLLQKMISNPIRTSTLKIVTKISEGTWEKRTDHDDFELDDYNEFYQIYKHKESGEGWLVKLKEEKINPYIK
jgi:DNA-directed RNA polymerase specialized sigma24 family protein